MAWKTSSVKYPVVNGIQVRLDHQVESVFGLTPFISSHNNYGVGNGFDDTIQVQKKRALARTAALRDAMKTIDWSRVVEVQKAFIGSNHLHSYKNPAKPGKTKLIISTSRYRELLRFCLKGIPEYRFEAQVEQAINFYGGKVKVFKPTVTVKKDLVNPTLKDVVNRYRTGSIGHGVLQLLAVRKLARTGEIESFFPSLHGSSTLTYMRRQGLITKVLKTNTSPYAITKLGVDLLALRGKFDGVDFKQKVGIYSPGNNC